IEDRMVKRFFQMRAGRAGSNNRYAPHTAPLPAQFELVSRKPILGTPEEIAQNPRARSAKLRIARRTASAAGGVVTPSDLGMPLMDLPL
ncbi:MAG: 16S rRNA (cytosine(1402)-N(4))-methyltransferase, partial [Paracoccaceae bacterium]